MSSMIGNITKQDIPILTETHQSCISRDDMIKKINNTGIVVGTPKEIVDYLPLINVKFDWVIIDEIHMIGKETCCEMETVVRLYYDTPILALSATIGNVEELKSWFLKTGQKAVDIIKCEKRFFNLQKFYYDNNEDKIKMIHPLSMISLQEILDGSIINKNLNPTPPDIYNLYLKLKDNFKLGKLDLYEYFKDNQRITLSEANDYFNKLIIFIVENYQKNKDKIMKILEFYENVNIVNSDVDYVKLCFTLKKDNKTPAIIFHLESYECLNKVKQFSKNVKTMEEKNIRIDSKNLIY